MLIFGKAGFFGAIGSERRCFREKKKEEKRNKREKGNTAEFISQIDETALNRKHYLPANLDLSFIAPYRVGCDAG